MTFPELAEDLGLLAPIKLDYVGNTISGPQDIQTVVTGDTDFGGAFNGAVIKLIAAKAPVKSVIGYYGTDENTWQGYYVLENSRFVAREIDRQEGCGQTHRCSRRVQFSGEF